MIMRSDMLAGEEYVGVMWLILERIGNQWIDCMKESIHASSRVVALNLSFAAQSRRDSMLVRVPDS